MARAVSFLSGGIRVSGSGYVLTKSLKSLSLEASGAPSGWEEITQERIDRFAAVTGDNNWYHLDAERAARELPGGRTLAHGLLTLALVPGLSSQIFRVTAHGRALNYGYEKLRFPEPVESGDRLRLHMEVTHAEPDRGGLMIRRNFKMEIEGKRRPGLVADALTLAY